MEEEKEKWEKIIRSKLYDFEADVNPDDWGAISGKLAGGGKSVALASYRRYGYIAAAAIAVLLIVGGLYFYPRHDNYSDTIAGAVDPVVIDTVVEKPVGNMAEKFADNSLTASLARPGKAPVIKDDMIKADEPPVRLKPLKINEADSLIMGIKDLLVENLNNKKKYVPENGRIKLEITPHKERLIADASAGTKRRRWGFGMGGGSYGMNSSSSNAVSSPSSMLRSTDEYLYNKPEAMKLRNGSQWPAVAISNENDVTTRAYEPPSGNVEHKTPISAGFGVGYYLNDRWSLQSGLTYTFLRSEWNFDNVADGLTEHKQYLHFIGIPLSLSCKIAEWNRFQLYASAGGMYEFNVAGKYTETIFPENLPISKSKNLHMKEPLWSVNVRGGINYPLWRFINVYAEAGASYYFDNKSEIETIRSDKPFNVSLQAGVRFGF
ncbi:MAG: PorT family protein [Tannerella sp.]|jgi:opacity protein-like surface antigen|nr:PorT family protein [Tannerella sp.]